MAFLLQESRPGLQEEMEGVGELVGQKNLDEAKASGHSCLTKSRELGFRVQGADRGHMSETTGTRVNQFLTCSRHPEGKQECIHTRLVSLILVQINCKKVFKWIFFFF